MTLRKTLNSKNKEQNMTPRSFFIILIKLMGVYVVISSLSIIPQLFSTILLLRPTDGSALDIGSFFAIMIVLILIYSMYHLTIKYCIFKTDWLVEKLALDQHFTEEKFELNIHRSTVLSIAVIVFGGIMFAESLPLFFIQVCVFIKQTQLPFGTENYTGYWAMFYFAKTALSYVFITNSQQVVNFIERQRRQ